MTKQSEMFLESLLEQHEPAQRDACTVVLKRRGFREELLHLGSIGTANLVETAINTARDLLAEVRHLRGKPRPGTLAWAVASGRFFTRDCWGNRFVCHVRDVDGERRVVAHPPFDPDFWYDLRLSETDALATDYRLL